MKRYLKSYINYMQDDWATWLSMEEFSVNNTKSFAIKTSPFFANTGYHPRMSYNFEPELPPAAANTRETIQRNKAETIAKKIKKV